MNGRLTGLQIDPEARRLPAERLADAILEAVNAVLDEQHALSAPPGTPVDLSGMVSELKQVQESAFPQLRAFIATMN